MSLRVSAGQIILADHINNLVPVRAAKASSLPARASTTSPTADPELSIALGVGEWLVISTLYVSGGNAAGDFIYRWGWTGTMTVDTGGVGPNNALASGSSADAEFVWQAPDSATPNATSPYGASSAGVSLTLTANVVVTVAGVLTLDWAQLSSNASATSVLAASRCTAFRTF